MRKKYLPLIVAALVTASAAAVAAIVLSRSRTEVPPVSPTVPRVEELGPTETATAAPEAR